MGTKAASVDMVTISSGGKQYIYEAGAAGNTTVDGGIQYVVGGGSVYNTIINSGGTLTWITSGIYHSPTISNITVNDGGNLVLNGASLDGTITLNAGTTLNLDNQISGDATFKLVGNGNHDIIIKTNESNKLYTMPIVGFQAGSDRILFQDLKADTITSIDYQTAEGLSSDDYVTIHYAESSGINSYITLHIPGIKQTGFDISVASDGSAIGSAVNSSEAPCFLAGTMVRIPGGKIAVEKLAIGDRVYTFDWKKIKKLYVVFVG